MTKKRRFFYVAFLYALYYYYPRLSRWIADRKVRTINKYKKRWIARYNPDAILYSTPDDFNYKSAILTPENQDRLAETFLAGERKLKNGFSR